MASRMERYQELDEVKDDRITSSRTSKNRNVYDELYNNATYTEFTDVNDRMVVELDNSNRKINTRESYHKTKEFHDVIAPLENKRPTRPIVIEEEKKNYDLNSVLQEAKQNRKEIDDLENKRKLKVSEYDILSDLSEEQLEKYKQSKKERNKEDPDELEDLINTITSRTLREDLDQDLMSDLLPSGIEETIITESLSKEILDKYNDENEEPKEEDEIDHSFYTKSMDLSTEDFYIEDTSFVEEKTKYIMLKLVLTIIALIILIIITIITLLK